MLSDITSASLLSSPLIIVALALWALELQRKDLSDASVLHALRSMVMKGFRFESCGLVLTATLVGVLCALQKNNGFESIPEEDKELWQNITSEWPVLMTADSLLSIQSMLRVVMLLSTVLRCGAGNVGSTPLVPEAASFMLLASICRITLIALSPFDVYHLDGPLGGAVYVIFEMVALPLLLLLSRNIIYQGTRGIAILAGGIAFSLAVARRQQFNLADAADIHLDMLFTMGLIFELPAALSFLVRSCVASFWDCSTDMEKRSSAGFAYALLPIQQGLSLYFLLAGGLAPPLETPKELVRAGHPFEFFWAACTAQVVIYMLAAIVHFASLDTADVVVQRSDAAAFLQEMRTTQAGGDSEAQEVFLQV